MKSIKDLFKKKRFRVKKSEVKKLQKQQEIHSKMCEPNTDVMGIIFK